MVQKRCHRHGAQDLPGGVAGSQQGDGAGESEQASGCQGHRAYPDEGGAEQDCTQKSRDRPWSHGGQSDPECLQKQRSREQSRMRPSRAQPGPQCGRRRRGQADEEPGAVAEPA
jgi:hypothetical protein